MLSNKRPRFNPPYIPALKDRGFTARLVNSADGSGDRCPRAAMFHALHGNRPWLRDPHVRRSRLCIRNSLSLRRLSALGGPWSQRRKLAPPFSHLTGYQSETTRNDWTELS